MDIEVESIEELDPAKIYHIELATDAGAEQINSFASAVKGLGLKALITRGQIRITTIIDMFKGLTEDEKSKLLEAIGEKSAG